MKITTENSLIVLTGSRATDIIEAKQCKLFEVLDTLQNNSI